MYLEERSVDGKVSGGARVGLDIDTPLGVVESEGSERTRTAQVLSLVDELVPAVVARPREALGVLVGHARSEALHDGLRGEVLGGDEFDAIHLTLLLLQKQVVHLRVPFLQREVLTSHPSRVVVKRSVEGKAKEGG